MKWNVTNALSRDVEREHLNKILKEIQAAIDSVNTSQSVSDADIIQAVRRLFEGTHKGLKIVYNPATKRMEVTTDSFTITLQGAVSGQGTVNSNGNVTIDTAISAGAAGIGEAPMTGEAFWRRSGDWDVVPYQVDNLRFLEPPGFPALQEDFSWIARIIQPVATETTVVDGDGLAGDPTIGVAPEIRQGVSRVPYTAGTTIHSLRAVAAANGDIYHPDLSTVADATNIVGIALQAGVATDTLEVQTAGPITDTGWTWTPGLVFVDDDGVLTQTAPTTGWLVSVGRATSSDTIEVQILTPIIRS